MEQDIIVYLKERRLELGLTMLQVAEKVGVSEGTISRWESGNISNMRRDRIAAYAKALDIDPAIIMGKEEPVHTLNGRETIKYMQQSLARMALNWDYLTDDDKYEIEHLVEFKANKNKKNNKAANSGA